DRLFWKEGQRRALGPSGEVPGLLICVVSPGSVSGCSSPSTLPHTVNLVWVRTNFSSSHRESISWTMDANGTSCEYRGPVFSS
ncbi:hypothetical protein GOODEAATRI_013422, partial [Goodea atripinnis]